MNENAGTAGGFKEVVVEVTGDGVYGVLKYESGVHRVQRVPETESQGRVHTSAASFAVLPDADEVDVEINDQGKRIRLDRSRVIMEWHFKMLIHVGASGYIQDSPAYAAAAIG